jgi:hypothetical protein
MQIDTLTLVVKFLVSKTHLAFHVLCFPYSVSISSLGQNNQTSEWNQSISSLSWLFPGTFQQSSVGQVSALDFGKVDASSDPKFYVETRYEFYIYENFKHANFYNNASADLLWYLRTSCRLLE